MKEESDHVNDTIGEESGNLHLEWGSAVMCLLPNTWHTKCRYSKLKSAGNFVKKNLYMRNIWGLSGKRGW